MNLKLTVLLFPMAALVAWPVRGLADEHDHDGHGHAEHDHHHHLPGQEVEASVAAQKLIGLKTQTVERRRIRSTVRLVGRFELMPQATVAAASPVAGRLALKVRPLQKVAAGDILFAVTSPDLQTRSQEIAVLERRLADYEATGAKNAALTAELALRRSARAALVGGADEQDGVVVVRAAQDGVVETLDLPDGAYAEQGAKVLTLVNPTAVWFKALVTPSDRATLTDGLPVSVGARQGTLRLGFGAADAVYAVFDAVDAAWRPGVCAEAFCETDATEKGVLSVPSAAVVQVGIRPIVFVKAEGEAEHFIAFEAELGVQGGGWTEIRNLKEEDAEVVVQGQYELKLALAASTGGGKKTGHFHADGVFHEADEH